MQVMGKYPRLSMMRGVVPALYQLPFPALPMKAIGNGLDLSVEALYVFVALDHITIGKRSSDPKVALFIFAALRCTFRTLHFAYANCFKCLAPLTKPSSRPNAPSSCSMESTPSYPFPTPLSFLVASVPM